MKNYNKRCLFAPRCPINRQIAHEVKPLEPSRGNTLEGELELDLGDLTEAQKIILATALLNEAIANKRKGINHA